MSSPDSYSADGLSIELVEEGEGLRMRFSGRCADREPGKFLMPMFTRGLQKSDHGKKPLVIDFTSMDYMNSSTFSPLVKFLELARLGPYKVSLEYADAKKWQRLSFAALKSFETPDGRISIRAR